MSDKVDQWVKKEPESWSKLAEKTSQGDSFDSFKKKFLKGARNQGKYSAVKHMTNEQILSIYNASGLSNTKVTKVKHSTKKAFTPKRVTIKRKGKTYTRTVTPRWEKHTQLALNMAAELPVRSKEYGQAIKNISKATGGTIQATKKKVQRVRKTKK